MSERWLGAAFFLPASEHNRHQWLTSHVRTALGGSDGISPPAPGLSYDSVLVRWGGLRCEALAVDVGQHRVLVLRFVQSSFLRMRDSSPAESDPTEALASDFALACDRLRPGIALIVVELWPDLVAYVEGLEGVVAVRDIERLLRTGPGLLYIDQPPAEYTEPALFDRELRRTENGVLIFAGSGKARWSGDGG